MWFRTPWFSTRSFLHKVLPLSHSLYCLWCRGLFLGTCSLLFFSSFFLLPNLACRSLLRVCLWFLVMSCLSHGFSCLLMYIGLILSVAGLSLSLHFFVIFIFMVLSTLSICGWLKRRVPSSSLVIYFVVSATGGLLFLLGSNVPTYSGIITSLSLLLLLGFAPFQFWVFRIVPHLSLFPLCIFLGPIKVGLLWLLVCQSNVTVSVAVLSLLLGLCILWARCSLALLLFGSGICQLLVFVILGTQSFLLYLFIYLFCLISVSLSSWKLLRPLIAILCLGGVPPIGIFWAKLMAFSSLCLTHASALLFVILISFWPYVRFGLTSRSACYSSLACCLLLVCLPAFLVL